jgi:hypothetical protein
MQVFSRRVYNSRGGDLIFNFAKIYTSKGERWFITFADYPYNYSFYMKPENGSWVIEYNTTLPEYLIEVEKQLAQVIMEHTISAFEK